MSRALEEIKKKR